MVRNVIPEFLRYADWSRNSSIQREYENFQFELPSVIECVSQILLCWTILNTHRPTAVPTNCILVKIVATSGTNHKVRCTAVTLSDMSRWNVFQPTIIYASPARYKASLTYEEIVDLSMSRHSNWSNCVRVLYGIIQTKYGKVMERICSLSTSCNPCNLVDLSKLRSEYINRLGKIDTLSLIQFMT